MQAVSPDSAHLGISRFPFRRRSADFEELAAALPISAFGRTPFVTLAIQRRRSLGLLTQNLLDTPAAPPREYGNWYTDAAANPP